MTRTSTREDITRPVRITAGPITLEGDLAVPAGARGIVLFAHGSGSGRHSPRNRFVASSLQAGGLATLLFDLLTEEEEYRERSTRHLRFDIGLLARRLVDATDWLAGRPETRGLRVGYFGASTGGGAALVAAAERPEAVGAVVSRGGRPDLAGEALGRVRVPTLLIVGGADTPVIALNRRAMAQMSAPVSLEIVAGATHLFEEPGTLEQVARLARDWFERVRPKFDVSQFDLRSGGDREPPPIHLRPELTPSFRRVAQRPQAQYDRRASLRPFHPRAAQPLLDDHLARRLRHSAADRLVRRHSAGVVHPTRPRLIGEVRDRPLHVLVAFGPRAFSGESPQLLQHPLGPARFVLQPVARILQPRLAGAGTAPVQDHRRLAQVLRRMPEVGHLHVGVPPQELPVALGPVGDPHVVRLGALRPGTVDLRLHPPQELRLAVLGRRPQV